MPGSSGKMGVSQATGKFTPHVDWRKDGHPRNASPTTAVYQPFPQVQKVSRQQRNSSISFGLIDQTQINQRYFIVAVIPSLQNALPNLSTLISMRHWGLITTHVSPFLGRRRQDAHPCLRREWFNIIFSFRSMVRISPKSVRPIKVSSSLMPKRTSTIVQ